MKRAAIAIILLMSLGCHKRVKHAPPPPVHIHCSLEFTITAPIQPDGIDVEIIDGEGHVIISGDGIVKSATLEPGSHCTAEPWPRKGK